MLTAAHAEWPVVLPPELLARHTRVACQTRAYKRNLTRGRMVSSRYAHVTPTEWAYLAGLIDGEGTIDIYYPTTRGKGSANRRVVYCNTHKGSVDWVVAKFPGSSVQAYLHRGRWKPLWQVRWCSQRNIHEILLGMLPYLIIKKENALRVLAQLDPKYTDRIA